MIVFFYHKGVIYQPVVPPKTTVNDEHYFSVLKILRQYMSREHHEMLRNRTLHNENALPHIATTVQQYLSKIMSHLPYSSDRAPCNFCFRRQGKSCVAENLIHILKLFQQSRILLEQLLKRGFSTCFEN